MGSCHKRQKAQAPKPISAKKHKRQKAQAPKSISAKKHKHQKAQAPIRKLKTRKVANANVHNRYKPNLT